MAASALDDDEPATVVASAQPAVFDDEPATMVAVSERCVLTNAETGKRHEFSLPCVIGRGRAADLKVSDNVQVGRKHARIYREDDLIMVRDLGSANGTAVGSVTLPMQGSAPIESGATLRLGVESFVFTIERG